VLTGLSQRCDGQKNPQAGSLRCLSSNFRSGLGVHRALFFLYSF